MQTSEQIEQSAPPATDHMTPRAQLPELRRSLHPRHVAMIAIGGIIGAGLFVGSSATIAAVGPAAICSYGLAGLLVLLIMRMLSEIALAVPGLRSFPDFPRAGLGNWAGFISGWLYWYFWVMVVAAEAIAGATIVHGWVPMLPAWLEGVTLMTILTGVNLLSARSFGEFEFWFSSIKVAAIFVFLIVTGAFAWGLTGDKPTFANLLSYGGFAPHGWGAVLAGVTSTIFALTGGEIATVTASETENAGRTMSRLTGTVAVRILMFYVLSILLIVSVVPWNRIVPGESPFATALAAVGLPSVAKLINVVVLVAVLSCLNSGLYVTSRVLFALAARGEAPAALSQVSKRGTPGRAILVASAFSYVALGISAVSPNVFAFLVNTSGALMLIIYLMVAAAELRIRSCLERDAPEQLTLRMWLHPWGAIGAIIGIASVLTAMALSPSLASQFYATLLPVVLVTIAFPLTKHFRATPFAPRMARLGSLGIRRYDR